MMTLMSARLCDYEGKRLIGLSACGIYSRSNPLHDDVVDESNLVGA